MSGWKLLTLNLDNKNKTKCSYTQMRLTELSAVEDEVLLFGRVAGSVLQWSDMGYHLTHFHNNTRSIINVVSTWISEFTIKKNPKIYVVLIVLPIVWKKKHCIELIPDYMHLYLYIFFFFCCTNLLLNEQIFTVMHKTFSACIHLRHKLQAGSKHLTIVLIRYKVYKVYTVRFRVCMPFPIW